MPVPVFVLCCLCPALGKTLDLVVHVQPIQKLQPARAGAGSRQRELTTWHVAPVCASAAVQSLHTYLRYKSMCIMACSSTLAFAGLEFGPAEAAADMAMLRFGPLSLMRDIQ